MAMELTPEELTSIYTWVDEIPLSRPKKNIARDFSDGVLAAEVVSYYCPRLVDIHNYSAANSLAQKMYNWNTLNERVFKHFNIQLTKEDITALASAQPLVIEAFLRLLKSKLDKCTTTARKCETEKADGGGEYKNHGSRRSSSEKNGSAEKEPSLASRKSTNQHSDSETQTLDSAENESSLSAAGAPNTTQIRELQETIEVLEAKVSKLEELMKLKTQKQKSARPCRQKQ